MNDVEIGIRTSSAPFPGSLFFILTLLSAGNLLSQTDQSTPTLSTLTNVLYMEENSSITVPFTLGDLDSALSVSNLSLVAHNEAIIPEAATNFFLNGGTIPPGTNGVVNLTITPAAESWGTVWIEVIVSDGHSAATNDLLLNVRPKENPPDSGSLPPVVYLSTNHLDMNQDTTALVTFYVSDPDSRLTRTNIFLVSTDAVLIPNGPGHLDLIETCSAGCLNFSLAITPTSHEQGSARIFFIVTDGLNFVTNTLDITVHPTGGSQQRPLNGLIGLWQGDGNADDTLGRNPGVLISNTGFPPGVLGQAFAFDGANGHLEIPDSFSSSPMSVTIETWIRPSGFGPEDTIVAAKGSSLSFVQFDLRLRPDPHGEFLLRGIVGSPTNQLEVLGTHPVSTNKWTHVALTYDFLTGVRLYQNASLDGVTPGGPPFWPNLARSGEPWRIGQGLLGLVDEFSLYDRALSPAEIESVYTAGKAAILNPRILAQPQNVNAEPGDTVTFSVEAIDLQDGPLFFQWQLNRTNLLGATNSLLILTNVQPPDAGQYRVLVNGLTTGSISAEASLIVGGIEVRPLSGLIGWWSADGDPNDSVGGHNGLLHGTAGFAPGRLGQAFEFHDGLDYLEIPDGPGLNPSSLSFDAWVYPADPPNETMTIFSCGSSSSLSELKLDLVKVSEDACCLRLSSRCPTNSWTVQGTRPMLRNTWNYIAVASDSQNGVRLYVDGQEDTRTTDTILWPSSEPGPWQLGGHPTSPYTGRIDEFCLYDRPLNALEVKLVYDTTESIVALSPQVLVGPKDFRAGIGGDARFEVSAISPGSLALAYQWQFYGTNLPGETDAQLVLRKVQPSQAGPYSVRIRSASGTVFSSAAMLTVAGVVAWGGENWYGELNVPDGLMNVVALAAGGSYGLVLRADGTIVGWGDNLHGQLGIQYGLSNVTAIAAGLCSMALKADGTVTGAGIYWPRAGWTSEELSNVVAVAAGGRDTVVLKADSTVISRRCDSWFSYPPTYVSNIVTIAGGGRYVLGLKADGTVVAWGDTSYGQLEVPAGLSNVVAISGNVFHCLALKADGTVTAWGGAADWWNVLTNVPPGLSNVVSIAAAGTFSLALRADGSIVQWGVAADGSPTNFIPNFPNAVAISCSDDSALALLRDGTPQMTVQPWDQSVANGATPCFVSKAVGKQSMKYQWQFNGNRIPGATHEVYAITNAQPENEGLYSVIVSNQLGNAVSRAAKLSLPAHPPGLNLTEAQVAYVIGGPPVFVDTNAQVTGVGSLTITVGTNATEQDHLEVLPSPEGPGAIGLEGNVVTYSGVVIGSLAGGQGNSPLTFASNASATSTGLTALVRRVAFSTSSTNSGSRVLEIALQSGDVSAVAFRWIILDRPPIARDDDIMAGEGVAFAIDFSQLVANDLDLDGDLLTGTPANSVSDQGNRICTDGMQWVYEPSSRVLTEDSFSYRLYDGHGGEATGMVTIHFLKQGILQMNAIKPSDSGVALQMGGIAGAHYQIQASSNLSEWIFLGDVTATPTGVIQITDGEARNHPTRFYRAVAQ